MFVVIFEVQPKAASWDAYLSHAAALKPELERIDGFLHNERFRSRKRDGWLVSLSAWHDEKALVRWRAHGAHHAVQADGRATVFQDYRLRVGESVDAATPARCDLTAIGAAKAALLAEGPDAALDAAPPPHGAVDWDRFDSIPNPGQGLLLSFWRDVAAAGAAPCPGGCRCRVVAILRDYGMFDRAEAPQYHPPVPAPPRV
jgi:heme-degrading monooxygenase HmoA